jgi:carbamoyltransferase
MALNIVGISSHFHDSSCCLLKDGELVAAAQEERFSRVKHDPRIPKLALKYCLEEAGLGIADVDCIAYYEQPATKLARQLWMGLPQLPTRRADALFRLDAHRPEREIREALGFDGRIEFVSHHEAHAASAYFYSGFDDAAVFTVDGVGEWATTTYGTAHGSRLELFEEVHYPHSIGLLYSAITGYLGFEVNEGEYKVMGLAPYGKPTYAEALRSLISLEADGQFRLRLEYFDFNRSDRMHTQQLCELLGRPPREPESDLCQFTKDVAKSLQVVLEEILLEKVKYLHRRYPSEQLCMAGGVALNCVANGKILKHGPFKRMFVQPASSDAGSPLGAAALAHVRLAGTRPAHTAMKHVYLGPRYSCVDLDPALRAIPGVLDFADREHELVQATAERLAAGKVIGWFHGRMEFGPRSLGARSILADPRGTEMRDRINALVKKREAFRPFAPAVLAAEAHRHFDLDHPSPFMLETCQVRSTLDLPAITHVDGSARVQTVDAETSPRFARLLEAFLALTGCPILLNTSFNLRGEPIVCTPIDAILCFIRSDIDCLVLEDYVIDRDVLPPSWIEWFRHTPAGGSAMISQSVYTLF